MTPRAVDRAFLRRLADWRSDGDPVSTLYLDVDGRKYPRKQDYLLRAEHLCQQLKRQAEPDGRDPRCSVAKDTARMLEYLQGLERRTTRGLALFACSGAGLWEDVAMPRPMPDLAVVADHPYVLRLETLVDTYESFCTVIVDREKARVFFARMGHIEEERDILDDVPGQHDQGGWSQARYQRHIEELVSHHLTHVADVLLAYFKRRKFDHLILAGPEELVPEFERHLHDYLKRRVASRTTLSMAASVDEVLERSLGVEEAVEAQREQDVVERIRAGEAAGRLAVTGLERVLDALNEGRVETLVVPFGLSQPGSRCSRCERLVVNAKRCPTCRGPVEPVHDVVERAVAAALRQSSRVEALPFTAPAYGDGRQIGAFLRY